MIAPIVKEHDTSGSGGTGSKADVPAGPPQAARRFLGCLLDFTCGACFVLAVISWVFPDVSERGLVFVVLLAVFVGYGPRFGHSGGSAALGCAPLARGYRCALIS